MKLWQRILKGSGAFALTAILLPLAAPRAAHAIAATLVQVVNTATNPAVSQDVSKLASQNISLGGFTEVNQSTGPFYSIGVDGSLSPAVYTVPAGQTLIITSVDLIPNLGVTANQEVGLGNSANPSNPTGFGAWDVPPGGSTQFVYPTGIALAGGVTPQLTSNNEVVLRLHG